MIKAGQRGSEGGERTAGALPKEDFKIEYVHAVTETQTNPQTGQQETVVVLRQEGGSFWAPLLGRQQAASRRR